MEQERAVQPGELVGGGRQALEQPRCLAVSVQEVGQAPPLHQLAHEVRPAVAQPAEAQHPGHAQPLDAGERHRLPHERLDLPLVRALREHLEGQRAPGDPVAHRPHLAAPALPERRHPRISQREARPSPGSEAHDVGIP